MGKTVLTIDDIVSFSNASGYEVQLGFADSKACSPRFLDIKPINDASKTDISFCRFDDKRGKGWVKNSGAGCVIVPLSMMGDECLKPYTTYVFAEYPRLALLHLIKLHWKMEDNHFGYEEAIHPTSSIGKNVKLGRNCVIGPYVEIGDGTQIGNNTTISNAKIGRNCRIGSCVTVGGDGFGFEDEGGDVEPFPHIGGVWIGDDVRIGSSTCIDRASLGQTIIENKVKIDNLVHIAHNVKIGEASKIIAMSIIGGSTTIGKNSWIAPGSSVRDWVEIGKDSIVGLGAVVVGNIPDDTAVVGNPAKPITKTRKRYK